MKNGRPRKPSQRREKAPAVICLPPPEPLVAEPEEDTATDTALASALSFPFLEEPLVTAKAKKPSASKSSRDRVQARKPSAKARRTGTKLLQGTTGPEQPVTATDTLAPLPKNQSLALTRPSMLHQLGGWLKGLVMVKKPLAGVPAAQISSAQLNTLRRQIDSLQRTLDRIEGGRRT